MQRHSIRSGIAIGPILFIIAILAVLAGAISLSTGGSGSASMSDRINVELRTQANLFRAKVLECDMITRGNAGAGFPATPSGTPTMDRVDCPGDTGSNKNLWTGPRPATFPVTPGGMQPWVYCNDGAGTICISICPITANAAATPVRAALSRAVANFSGSEISYDSASTDQRISVFIIRNGSAVCPGTCTGCS